ncbi:MAG TPA: D-alanyl-lipoteichoic acid biosynthesis protein DltD [Candidatus Binatia bacterium]|nr:D-alanyl-lipoteichoic acid biosynthesis protein DltD [Candidatus Binatia bacterium]
MAIAAGVACGRQVYALQLARRYVDAVAGMDVPIKYESLTFQRAALADRRVLPIYGSSELFCCGNPFLPTELFASAPSGFTAFAVGRYGGTGDLFFMETFAALGRDLAGRRLVLSDSPQWFVHRVGANPAGYLALFSPEIAYGFVFDAPVSRRLRAAGARRMLDYPQTLRDDPLLRAAVASLARPTRLHRLTYVLLVPLGRLTAWMRRVHDADETVRFIRRHRRLRPNRPPRPAPLDWAALAARGTMIAGRRDTTNPFGFPNPIFRTLRAQGKVQDALALYQAGGTNRDGQRYPFPAAWEAEMAHSREWTDLRLLLGVVRELGGQPLVWTVPMSGFYDDYTSLAAQARQGYYDHYEHTARAAAVPWLDFRDHDEDPYFLTDMGAHFSARGWVFADRALDMFWHGQPIDRIRDALTALGRAVPAPAPLVTAAGGVGPG